MVLTKWDTRPDFNVCGADAVAETAKAVEFLRDTVVFGQCYSALAQSGTRVQVFPVSAFGSHRDGQLPPANGPEPFNIHTPLKWSVEMAEEMIGEKADRDADGLLVHRWWPRYDKAANLLKQTILEYAIRAGLVGERLAERARSLNRRLWLRRLTMATFILGLAIVVAVAALIVDERKSYNSVVYAYGDSSMDATGVKALTDEYLSKRNPLNRIHEHVIRDRWGEFQREEGAKGLREPEEGSSRAHASFGRGRRIEGGQTLP